MKKSRILSLVLALTVVASTATVYAGAKKNIKVAFIPKLTGNMFFESANVGAQDIAKKVGFTAKYDGSPEASVANQVQIINSEVNQGANAIAISALSPDGLSQALTNASKKGVKIVTWDSDINPKNRAIYVDQGTPEILGTMLVDMAASQMTPEQLKSAKIALFYSSPTVTDQNSWAEYAKKYIAKKYPGWKLVTTQYGEQDAQKSLTVGQSILQTYPDIDAILCPDSTALPAMAQAAKNLDKSGKVIITGFATPSSMRGFVKDGTVPKFGLWDCKVQGAIGAYIAYWLASGNTFKVGDSINVPGVGKLKIQPNTIQGYKYTAPNSGIVLLPNRVIFTKDNIDKYNF